LLENLQGVLHVTKLPDSNPKTIHGMSKPGIANVPPIGVLEVGRVMEVGAQKYGPSNWRHDEVSYSTYYNAAMRHLFEAWDGNDLDFETGCPHLAHAAACLMILLDAKAVGKLIDDRPKQGAASYFIKANTRKITVDDNQVQA
jgi:hypothetical protein